MPNLAPAASNTRMPSGTTSLPMPSPGMTAIRYSLIRSSQRIVPIRFRPARAAASLRGLAHAWRMNRVVVAVQRLVGHDDRVILDRLLAVEHGGHPFLVELAFPLRQHDGRDRVADH